MYTLRLPFELPENLKINDTGTPISRRGLEYKLKKDTRFYVLIVKGFATEEDANSYIVKSWSGLMWVLLNCGIAPKFVTEPQTISYSKDPVEVAKNLSKNFDIEIEDKIHGLIDGSRPAIFDSEGNYRSLTGGNVNLIGGVGIERFFEFYFSGVEETDPLNGFCHKKLRIALELYAAFFSERTPNAKFLTLVMVLETLAESEKRPKPVLDILAQFRGQIEEIENDYTVDSDERISLESLKRELTFRQEDSIRKQIRSLVFNTLSENGDSDAKDIAKKALRVYDKRSTLVHEGSLKQNELGQVSTDARDIVERVLRAKFKIIVGGNHV